MFGIKKKLGCLGTEKGQGIVDDLQVAFQGDSQGLLHVDVPGLAKDGNDLGFGRNQGLEIFVGFRRRFGHVRAAKGGHLGGFQLVVLDFLEKTHVRRIGPRPAAFNIPNAQVIKLAGDSDFVRR